MSPIALYFFVMVGVLMPVLCVRSYFKLKAGAPFPPKPKLRRQTIIMELLYLTLSLVVWRDTHMTLFARHFPGARDWSLGALALVAFVAFMLPLWKHAAITRRERTYRRMPASEAELPVWSLVALLAGTVEEIVYRGVLFGILMWWLHNWWAAALLCALSFALAHAIQGLKSTAIIFVMSVIFQALVLTTGSLYVAMAVHVVYDVIAGVMYARFYKLGENLSAPSAASA